MLKRFVAAALVVAMMVPLPMGLANAGAINVTPNSPYMEGLNGIVVEGSASSAAVAQTIEAESGLEVAAIWLLSGTWQFYLPDQPEVDGGLNEFPGPVAAAFVVLAGGTPTPPPTPSPTPSPTPPPTMTPSPTPPPTPAPSCDPSYPGVCIPPPPPDLDCGDILERQFTVLPPDPHGFDGDGNGVGCESP